MTDINVANERLAEIKARAENTTTSGPWEHRETDALPPGLGNVYPADSIYPLIGCGHCGENDAAYETGDGEFIAHARTDVPALVAALEAVLTQTAAMREVAATGYSDRTTRLILESWADEIEAAITEALEVDQ